MRSVCLQQAGGVAQWAGGSWDGFWGGFWARVWCECRQRGACCLLGRAHLKRAAVQFDEVCGAGQMSLAVCRGSQHTNVFRRTGVPAAAAGAVASMPYKEA